MSKEKVIVGLCEGRHNLPVDTYVFPGQINPTDVEGMLQHALEFVETNCNCHHTGFALSANTQENACGWMCTKELVLYVTGLTAACAAVMSACATLGCSLTLMHYDRETGGYFPQAVLMF